MDVEKLAKELAGLCYQTGYTFQNGQPFSERLSEGDVLGLLRALRDRGYMVSRDEPAHVESPQLSDVEQHEPEPTH
jgi:hypothetical protein